MAQKRIPRRPKRRRQATKRAGATPIREDLNKGSRALLGEDDAARKVRPQAEDASVEDPLLDWPEE